MASNLAPTHHAVTSDSAPRTSGVRDDAAETAQAHQSQSVRPATETINQPRGSLSSTVGPFQQPTTEHVAKSDIPPSSTVGQQNAPGRAGSIGEATLGALGYGGTAVERPKEEQGLGEKIVNLLGA